MLGKKEIKDIQSLEQKKFRDDLGLFIAEGPKIVRELLLEKRSMVQQLYATESWIRQNSNILTPACVAVSEQELGRISQLKTPNQVLAVVRQQQDNEPVISGRLCLYLDTIQDPGNLGTIIRIAGRYHKKQKRAARWPYWPAPFVHSKLQWQNGNS